MNKVESRQTVLEATRALVINYGLTPVTVALIKTCEEAGFGTETFLDSIADAFQNISNDAFNMAPLRAGRALRYSSAIRELISGD